MKRRWRLLAQVLVAVAVVYFIATYLVHYWAQVRAYHWSIRPLPLALSALVFLLFYLLQGGAWWLLLRGFTLPSSFACASATWGKSILARYMPGNVFMFLGRLVEHAPTLELFLSPRQKETEMYVTGRYG